MSDFPTPDDVLDFWLGPLGEDGLSDVEHSACWYKKDPAFDQTIRDRFGGVRDGLLSGTGPDWLGTVRGRLAAVIVLDQFSRNMHRDSPQMYRADPVALRIAKDALAHRDHRELGFHPRSFLYMPFMHSEHVADQDRCVELFRADEVDPVREVAKKAEQSAHYARLHRDIVARFGRFPHRNAILGRVSTPQEIAFLQQPNSSF